jgi:ATP-dependent DNA ligase
MIYKIIQELKATRSRNEKEAILQKNVDNADLKEFFRLALSPSINFYQKKAFTQEYTGNASLKESMEWLENVIAKRLITGNSAVIKIQQCLDWLSADDAKVIMHILQKESGCDLGASIINKIWPKLIPEFPNLLASPFSEKLAAKLNWAAGVYSQRKSDGGRVAIIVEKDGTVGVFSRAGNELNVHGFFDFLGEEFAGYVIDGELLSTLLNGKFASRQESNGIFNKCVRNTLSVVESERLHITAWDLIPIDDFGAGFSAIEYDKRFNSLNTKIAKIENFGRCSVIFSKIVYSLTEAQEHYNEERANGEEGTMIKDRSMPWEDKRSKLQLKLKAINTGEFEVIGYKDGVGELLGNLGSLNIASLCRKVISDMSGFSLKLRSEIYANLIGAPVDYVMVIKNEEVTFTANVGDTDIDIGSIIEVAYNAVVKGKDSKTYSLFLPRFEKTRLDKTVANTFEELK